jgi:hypothetical protein
MPELSDDELRNWMRQNLDWGRVRHQHTQRPRYRRDQIGGSHDRRKREKMRHTYYSWKRGTKGVLGIGARRSTSRRPLRRCIVRTADGTPWAGRIWLAVNGVVKQNADLSELIWPVPDIISILSRSMELNPGDGNAGQRRRDRCRRQGHRRH